MKKLLDDWLWHFFSHTEGETFQESMWRRYEPCFACRMGIPQPCRCPREVALHARRRSCCGRIVNLAHVVEVWGE